MAEEFDAASAEEALGRFELEIRGFQTVEHFTQAVQLFVESSPEDDYVIQIDQAGLIG